MFVLFFALDLRQKSYLRLENQKFLCLRIFWTADLGVRNKLRFLKLRSWLQTNKSNSNFTVRVGSFPLV